MTRNHHFRKLGRQFLAAMLASLVLLLNALATSPALHELIHKDAGQADHQCAVTLFAQGKVDSPACEVTVPAPALLVETTPKIAFSVFHTNVEGLPPGRAPPPAVSSQA